MAVGKPVVTSSRRGKGGIGQMGNRIHHAARAADAMSRRICELLKDPSLRQRLGVHGRRTVTTRFEMPVMARNLYKVYEKCLAQSHRKHGQTPVQISH
jgi:glycosyltransferase involved in cell wall biosynthesis